MRLFFFAMFLMLGISGGLIGTSLPALRTQFEVAPDQSGLFVTMHTLGAIVGLYSFGRLLDQRNSRQLIWLPLTLVAVGMLGVHISSTSTSVFIAFFTFGIGFGGVIMCGNVLVGRLFAPNASPQLNLLNVFFGVGGILGPQIANWSIAQNQVTLSFLLVFVSAALLIPFSFLIKIAPPDRSHAQAALRWTPHLWASLLPFIAYMFLYIGAEVGFSSWIYTRVSNLTPLDAAAASTVVSLFWIGLTGGRVVGSVLSRRLSDEVLLLGTSLGLTASVVLILLFPNDGTISAIATFAFGFMAGPMFSSALSIIGRMHPQNAGQISGVILALANFGPSVIPYLQGQVGRGIDGGFVVTLAATTSLIVLALLIHYRKGRIVIES